MTPEPAAVQEARKLYERLGVIFKGSSTIVYHGGVDARMVQEIAESLATYAAKEGHPMTPEPAALQARLEIHRARLQIDDPAAIGPWSNTRVRSLLEAVETL